MNTIAVQEIKRRGMHAVDALMADGPVRVIRQNKPAYVVLSEAQYQRLLRDLDETYLARVAASLEDVTQGRVRHFRGVAALMAAIDKERTR